MKKLISSIILISIALFLTAVMPVEKTNRQNKTSSSAVKSAQAVDAELCDWNPPASAENSYTCQLYKNYPNEPSRDCVRDAVWTDWAYSTIGAYINMDRPAPNRFCNILTAREGERCDFSRGASALAVVGKCDKRARCLLDCELCFGGNICSSPQVAEDDVNIIDQAEKHMREAMTIELRKINIDDFSVFFRAWGVYFDMDTTTAFTLGGVGTEGFNPLVKAAEKALRRGEITPFQYTAIVQEQNTLLTKGVTYGRNFLNNIGVNPDLINTVFNFAFGFIEIKKFALENMQIEGIGSVWTYPVYICTDNPDQKLTVQLQFTKKQITGALFGVAIDF